VSVGRPRFPDSDTVTKKNSLVKLAWCPLGGGDVDAIGASLAQSGLWVASDAAIVLVTVPDYLSPELGELAKREKRPWLLVKPYGDEIWIGPTFELPESTCYTCLAHWIYARRAAGPPPPIDDRRILRTAGIDSVAAAAAELAQGHASRGPATTIAIVNAATGVRTEVIVPARLRCQCHGPRLGTPSTSGVVNTATGIAYSMTRSHHAPAQLSHVSCMHVYPSVQRGSTRAPQQGSAFGRGRTTSEAVDACIAEAIERYSAVWQGTEPMVLAKFNSGGDFLNPGALTGFSNQQYEVRHDWNAATDSRFHIPAPFDATRATYWSPVRSLRNGRLHFAPTTLVYGGFTGDSNSFGWADSIGCAAGGTLEAAILSALLEKIERDAVTMWWYSRARRPRVATERIDCERLRRAVDEARENGLEVEVLDITTDIDVPAVVCIGTRRSGRHPHFGAAANPDPIVAATRAVEEMLQMHFWSSRAQLEPTVAAWLNSHTLETEVHLLSGGVVDLPPVATDIENPLEWSLGRVWAAGLEVYFVDLTRPEVGLPVARVIIPESRHCWNRLGPGRLFDVPVRLGWVTQRLAESELNPVPCPL